MRNTTLLSAIKYRLKSNKGESIAEALLAILICSLGLTALASMVTAATSSVKKSQETMDKIYAAKNNVEIAMSYSAEQLSSLGASMPEGIENTSGNVTVIYDNGGGEYSKQINVIRDGETGFAGFKYYMQTK